MVSWARLALVLLLKRLSRPSWSLCLRLFSSCSLITCQEMRGWFLPSVVFLEELYCGTDCLLLTSFLELRASGLLSGGRVSSSGRGWLVHPNLHLMRCSPCAGDHLVKMAGSEDFVFLRNVYALWLMIYVLSNITICLKFFRQDCSGQIQHKPSGREWQRR